MVTLSSSTKNGYIYYVSAHLILEIYILKHSTYMCKNYDFLDNFNKWKSYFYFRMFYIDSKLILILFSCNSGVFVNL